MAIVLISIKIVYCFSKFNQIETKYKNNENYVVAKK